VGSISTLPIKYHPSYIKPPPIFTPNMVAFNKRARKYGSEHNHTFGETVGEAKWYKLWTFRNCVSGTLNKREKVR
jgi:hypothetical protein